MRTRRVLVSKHINKKLLICILGLCILISVIFALYLFFSKENAGENSDTSVSDTAAPENEQIKQPEQEQIEGEIIMQMDGTFESVAFEAEDAVLINNAKIVKKSNASGGVCVNNMGSDGRNRPNGTVLFQNVEAELPGIYKLTITYASDATDRYFKVSVNGGTGLKHNCPSSGSWEKFAETSMEIELNKGINTISLSCDDWYAPDLDKIEILYLRKAEVEERISIDGRIKLEIIDGIAAFNKSITAYDTPYALDISYIYDSETVIEITTGGSVYSIECKAETAGIPVNQVIYLEQVGNEIKFSSNSGVIPVINRAELYPAKLLNGGGLTLIYDINGGVYSVVKSGKTIIHDAFSSVRIDETLYSTYEYSDVTIAQAEISDEHGKGTLFTVTRTNPLKPTLIQEFAVYSSKNYFTVKLSVSSNSNAEISTNYISPLSVNNDGAIKNTVSLSDYFLQVPFDNDGWIKFELSGINHLGLSHEVTAIFNADSATQDAHGQGIILGSLTHDTWKTGIEYKGSHNQIDKLSLYGGANSDLTRDKSPHGKVSGKIVSSPVMFVGFYTDWQEGMNEYAKANNIYAPRRNNFDKVPVGWNSWGVIAEKITQKLAIGVSDYIKENFQDSWITEEDDVVYINLDSFWDNFKNWGKPDGELAEFVKYVHENGQKAGIYWTPFALWSDGNDLKTRNARGTNYKLYDIILTKSDGTKYGKDLDGGYPVDVTHPGAKMMFDYHIEFFKELGFDYIKLDFLTHGALEGKHYDESIAQTGIQAYNYAMKYISDGLGDSMFINLSIAPTFPYQYADGKRIGCDAWYGIGDTEYTLNGLTYGFWQKELYKYPDPDHIIVWGKDGNATEAEARSRVTSGILLGTSFLSGDNFVKPSGNSDKANERFLKLLANKDIVNAAKIGKIFSPYYLQTENPSADTFIMRNENTIYLAVLNYSRNSKVKKEIDISEFVNTGGNYVLKELWSGESVEITGGKLEVSLNARDSKVFRLDLQ